MLVESLRAGVSRRVVPPRAKYAGTGRKSGPGRMGLWRRWPVGWPNPHATTVHGLEWCTEPSRSGHRTSSRWSCRTASQAGAIRPERWGVPHAAPVMTGSLPGPGRPRRRLAAAPGSAPDSTRSLRLHRAFESGQSAPDRLRGAATLHNRSLGTPCADPSAGPQLAAHACVPDCNSPARWQVSNTFSLHCSFAATELLSQGRSRPA
jgi:hypothetical protein